MLLGIVSDTHGHSHYTRDAVRMLESLQVDAVLHCGDIGGPRIPGLFRNWPTHYVFGNVDRDEAALRAAIAEAGHYCHGRFGSLLFEGVRIALLHSDDTQRFRRTIAGGDYDVVCYGHTHQAEHHREQGVLVLNPGAIYRATPHSIALLEVPQMEVHGVALAEMRG